MENINDIKHIRFIKLGKQKDGIEGKCLDEGLLYLGYEKIKHPENDEKIRKQLKKTIDNKSTVTSHLNQIKKFYNNSKTLWITFANKKIYWGTTSNDIHCKEGSFTFKKLDEGWKDTNKNDEILSFENISGALLKTQGFRGTICDIKTKKKDSFDIEEYTKKLINGESIKEVKEAKESVESLNKSIGKLLKMLHPKDFEYFIDLIFQYSGWKKLTPGAGVEKDLDLDLLMPLTNERAFVQIKSNTTKNEIEEYIKTFDLFEIYDRMFFVYHSSNQKIDIKPESKKPVAILGVEEISKLIVELGLINILIKKVG